MENQSSLFHRVNIFNEGRFLMDLEFTERADAVREAVSLQEDGFTTEILTLSTANVFDTAPDDYNRDVDRFAY